MKLILVSCAICIICLSQSVTAQLSFHARRDLDSKHYPSAVVVGDLNSDNIADIVSANFGSSDLSVFLGQADRTFRSSTNIRVGSGPVALVLADLNKDGHPDVAVANLLSANVR